MSESGPRRESSEEVDENEQQLLQEIKDANREARHKSGVVGGIVAGLGGMLIFSNPLIAAPAAVAGAGGAWKYLRSKQKKQVKEMESALRSSDVLQGNVGMALGNTSSSTPGSAGGNGGRRPDLKRLKFLTKWGKLQLEDVLKGETMKGEAQGLGAQRRGRGDVSRQGSSVRASSCGTDSGHSVNAIDEKLDSLQAQKIERIVDEIVLSFSPWIQEHFLKRRGFSFGPEVRAELATIRLHLSPLQRFLQSDSVVMTYMASNIAFERDWTAGAVEARRMLRRCKEVFPAIIEMDRILHEKSPCATPVPRSDPPSATGGSWIFFGSKSVTPPPLSSPSSSHSELRHHGLASLIKFISEFLRRRDVQEYMADCLIAQHSGKRLPLPPGPPEAERQATMLSLPDEEVQLPAAGEEFEVNSEDFFSASDGEDEEPHGRSIQKKFSKSLSGIKEGKRMGMEEEVKLCGVPRSEDEEEVHTIGDVPHENVRVRGPSYLSDGVKVTSAGPLLQGTALDVFYSEDAIEVASVISSCRAYWLRRELMNELEKGTKTGLPFVFSINWLLGGLQAVMTFCTWIPAEGEEEPEEEEEEEEEGEKKEDRDKADFLRSLARRHPEWRALKMYLEGDEETRHGRLKVIPCVVEGPWLVQTAVGQTPAIIARKLTTTYSNNFQVERSRGFALAPYFETTIDVCSSVTARNLMGIVCTAARRLVMDIGLVVEGKTEDELPERLLGGMRMRYVDLDAARRIEKEAEEEKEEQI